MGKSCYAETFWIQGYLKPLKRTVIHKTAKSFWECYENLPIEIRNLAKKKLRLERLDMEYTNFLGGRQRS